MSMNVALVEEEAPPYYEDIHFKDGPKSINPSTLYLDPGALAYSSPGFHVYHTPEPVPDYMWLAAVAFIFCWPMAIVALVKGNECKMANVRGDHRLARKKSSETLHIALFTIGFGMFAAIVTLMVKVFAFPDRYYRY